jgi:hypothetical protein
LSIEILNNKNCRDSDEDFNPGKICYTGNAGYGYALWKNPGSFEGHFGQAGDILALPRTDSYPADRREFN